ncbi:ABC transporter ATP-binding protein [Treponema sp. Marseille-Q3903]|uniref:ABC transporter ATP-binding protein n=1 Tax=Treponema sp. Marseille-Q3903 TaxID=2766703 RepID=UPI00165289C7|nr:ABC transporter ATP-binding protein [Treponema sp. Marseille-Q3903]MBC6713338.1 ABC transporter ATP-binding protein [Treponema sp. Marseille-Q3903]
MARNKFDADEEIEQKFNPHIVMRLMKWIKPYTKWMVLSCIIMLVSSAISLTSPYLTRMAIDKAIPNKDYKMLAIISAILLASTLLVRILLAKKLKIMTRVAQRIIVNIRKDVFIKLQSLPFSYFDSRPHGKILIRVVNYVNSLSELLSNGIIQLISDLFTLIVIIGFMVAIDVKLTLVAMAVLPVLFIILFSMKKKQHEAWKQESYKRSNLTAYLSESLNGMKITQSFAREDVNQSIFDALCRKCKKVWIHAVNINNIIWPCVDILSTLGVTLVYIAGINWVGETVTIGTLVAFAGYIWRFWQPIQNLGNFYNSMVTTGAYIERIFELLDEKDDITDKPDAVELPPIRGHVCFDHVNFSYEPENPVLKDIDFTITPGMTVAIVGPTGAGKTTIVNLLSRFYNPDDGKILIDELDIQDLQIKSIRKQVGVMLQDSFLFSGTIMENIRYGCLDATDEQVINAAKSVQAHEFISAFPDGYNTKLSANGGGLSQGQKQLISFARVLLSDPRILILDEATSSVDTHTEKALQKGLGQLLKGRTSFIIAHRLSTIRNADIIFYVDHGEIVERGNHHQLVELGGNYAKMVNF